MERARFATTCSRTIVIVAAPWSASRSSWESRCVWVSNSAQMISAFEPQYRNTLVRLTPLARAIIGIVVAA